MKRFSLFIVLMLAAVFFSGEALANLPEVQIVCTEGEIVFSFNQTTGSADSVQVDHITGEPWPVEWVRNGYITQSGRTTDRIVFERDCDPSGFLRIRGIKVDFHFIFFAGGEFCGDYDKEFESYPNPEPQNVNQPTTPTQVLIQNYPNPFNPVTNIQYSIPRTSKVSLEIYNTLGQRIATLYTGERISGNYNENWWASNQPSGTYFAILITTPVWDGTGNVNLSDMLIHRQVIKMQLLK